MSKAKILEHTAVLDSKDGTDTIRLWENYKDQALLWRAIALIQVPATIIALLFSVVIWLTRSITLEVPARPLPGVYLAKEIPDIEFIETATEYINLIATYQPSTAKRQFMKAREMLKDVMIEKFDIEMVNEELRAIETTNRTQIFFIDPTKTAISREGNYAAVSLEGVRYKVIAGKEIPTRETRFVITMTTIPRNVLNPYGIVVTNVIHKNLDEEIVDREKVYNN